MKIDWENDEDWSMLYDQNNKGKSGKREKPEIEKGKCMINVGVLWFKKKIYKIILSLSAIGAIA